AEGGVAPVGEKLGAVRRAGDGGGEQGRRLGEARHLDLLGSGGHGLAVDGAGAVEIAAVAGARLAGAGEAQRDQRRRGTPAGTRPTATAREPGGELDAAIAQRLGQRLAAGARVVGGRLELGDELVERGAVAADLAMQGAERGGQLPGDLLVRTLR